MVSQNLINGQSSSQWTGGLNVSLVLDQPSSVSFTNLDEISGKVLLRCAKRTDISSILVKLEGESRTRLMTPAGPQGERPKPQLEYHKVGPGDRSGNDSKSIH